MSRFGLKSITTATLYQLFGETHANVLNGIDASVLTFQKTWSREVSTCSVETLCILHFFPIAFANECIATRLKLTTAPPITYLF